LVRNGYPKKRITPKPVTVRHHMEPLFVLFLLHNPTRPS
jgi:hypothetical protein